MLSGNVVTQRPLPRIARRIVAFPRPIALGTAMIGWFEFGENSLEQLAERKEFVGSLELCMYTSMRPHVGRIAKVAGRGEGLLDAEHVVAGVSFLSTMQHPTRPNGGDTCRIVEFVRVIVEKTKQQGSDRLCILHRKGLQGIILDEIISERDVNPLDRRHGFVRPLL